MKRECDMKRRAAVLLVCLMGAQGPAFGEAVPENQFNIGNEGFEVDADFKRLAPQFIQTSNEPGFSDYLRGLRRYLGRNGSERFSRSDSKVLKAWLDGRQEHEMRIVDAVNAYEHAVLMPFDEASVFAPRPELMAAYAIALNDVNGYYDVAASNHFQSILLQMTAEGRETIESILRTEVDEEVRGHFESGSTKRARIDYVEFARAYPEVLAKQVHLEAAARLRNGPPVPVVMEETVIAVDPESGAMLMGRSLVQEKEKP